MVRWSQESGDFDCQWFVPGARLARLARLADSLEQVQDPGELGARIQVNLNQVQLGKVHTFDLYRCFMGIFGFQLTDMKIGSTDLAQIWHFLDLATAAEKKKKPFSHGNMLPPAYRCNLSTLNCPLLGAELNPTPAQ